MLADIALRRSAYAEADLFASSGRYGVVRWVRADRALNVRVPPPQER